MFENLSDRLERSFKLLKGEGKITELNVAETLKDVRRALLDADVNYKVAKQFTDTVKAKAIGQNVLTALKPSQLMVKIVHDELALLMGASGIQMGTRFLVAEECVVHANVKEKLIASVDTDTIVTGFTIGGSVRGVKNKFSEEFVALELSGKATRQELLDRATGTNRLAAVDGDVVNGMVQAGETLTLLRKIEPVKSIIDSIVNEARETLARAHSIEI